MLVEAKSMFAEAKTIVGEGIAGATSTETIVAGPSTVVDANEAGATLPSKMVILPSTFTRCSTSLGMR